jgi:hypothetical protein
MSIEMVTAYESDGNVIRSGAPDYFGGDEMPSLTNGMYGAVENEAGNEPDNENEPDEAEPGEVTGDAQQDVITMDDLK